MFNPHKFVYWVWSLPFSLFMYLKEKQYKIAMLLLCPVQGPWASSFINVRQKKAGVSDQMPDKNQTHINCGFNLKKLGLTKFYSVWQSLEFCQTDVQQNSWVFWQHCIWHWNNKLILMHKSIQFGISNLNTLSNIFVSITGLHIPGTRASFRGYNEGHVVLRMLVRYV